MWTSVQAMLLTVVLGMTISTPLLAESLDAAFADLVLAMREGDSDMVDDAACVDARVAERLRRMEQLGLVDDADDPGLVEAERFRLSDALSLWALPMINALANGYQLNTTRVVTAEEGEFTAQGVLGVVLSEGRVLDIPVYQRETGRWCLEPSAPPR